MPPFFNRQCRFNTGGDKPLPYEGVGRFDIFRPSGAYGILDLPPTPRGSDVARRVSIANAEFNHLGRDISRPYKKKSSGVEEADELEATFEVGCEIDFWCNS